jgi:hypothetical protein
MEVLERIMVETPDANSGENDSPRDATAQTTGLPFVVRLLVVTFLGAVVAGGTVALGIGTAIGLDIDDKLKLAILGLLAYAVVPTIGVMVAALLLATWTRRLARALFLAIFAIGYVILGFATFRPSRNNLAFDALATEYVLHWAIVGAIGIPTAWLIGKLALLRKNHRSLR